MTTAERAAAPLLPNMHARAPAWDAVARKCLLGVPCAGHGLVGRWLARVAGGVFATIPSPPRHACGASA